MFYPRAADPLSTYNVFELTYYSLFSGNCVHLLIFYALPLYLCCAYLAFLCKNFAFVICQKASSGCVMLLTYKMTGSARILSCLRESVIINVMTCLVCFNHFCRLVVLH